MPSAFNGVIKLQEMLAKHANNHAKFVIKFKIKQSPVLSKWS